MMDIAKLVDQKFAHPNPNGYDLVSTKRPDPASAPELLGLHQPHTACWTQQVVMFFTRMGLSYFANLLLSVCDVLGRFPLCKH